MAPGVVTVMGGGVAGMAAALLLARDGVQVTLLERDDLEVGAPAGAPSPCRPDARGAARWDRGGQRVVHGGRHSRAPTPR